MVMWPSNTQHSEMFRLRSRAILDYLAIINSTYFLAQWKMILLQLSATVHVSLFCHLMGQRALGWAINSWRNPGGWTASHAEWGYKSQVSNWDTEFSWIFIDDLTENDPSIGVQDINFPNGWVTSTSWQVKKNAWKSLDMEINPISGN